MLFASIVDGEFVTERVLSATETRGTKAGARPMTERDLKVLEEKRGKIHEALDGALGGSIRIEGGAPSAVVVGDARGDDADEAISGAGGRSPRATNAPSPTTTTSTKW